MKILIYNIIVVLTIGNSYGQTLFNSVVTAQNKSIGGQLATTASVESFSGNAALLSLIEKYEYSITGEKRFIDTDINGFNATAGIKTNNTNGGIAGSFEYYGLSSYNHLNFKLGYGLKISSRIAIGASGGYNSFQNNIDALPSNGNLQVGGLFFLNSTNYISCSFVQSFVARDYSYPRSSTFLLGLKYAVSSLVSIYSELEKSNIFPANVKVGLEYELSEKLSVRSGIASLTQTFSTGIGYYITSAMKIDAAFSIHQQLGLTPTCTVKYLIKKKDSE